MPTVTPQARVQINPDPEASPHPRRTIVHSTGMMPPKGRAPQAPPAAASVATPSAAQIGQPVTTEAPASAVTLSPQLTALARRQQKLQQEIQAQRDKEAAWEREKAGYVPKDSIKAKAQQNAVEALQEAMGMSYDELTNLLVTQQNGADPVAAVAAEVKQLRAEQEQATNKQFEAIVKQYKAEAKTQITKEAEKYAFLAANPEWIDGAVQYIVDEWEANPDNVVSIDDALELAEENLREDAKKQAAILSKIQGPKTEPTTQTVPGKKILPPPQTSAPRTLTQSVESATPTRNYGQFQHMSLKERIAEAVKRASR